jgi:hypothetical protein
MLTQDQGKLKFSQTSRVRTKKVVPWNPPQPQTQAGPSQPITSQYNVLPPPLTSRPSISGGGGGLKLKIRPPTQPTQPSYNSAAPAVDVTQAQSPLNVQPPRKKRKTESPASTPGASRGGSVGRQKTASPAPPPAQQQQPVKSNPGKVVLKFRTPSMAKSP